jgi:hypothetical protein
MAGRSGRIAALRANHFGNVSSPAVALSVTRHSPYPSLTHADALIAPLHVWKSSQAGDILASDGRLDGARAAGRLQTELIGLARAARGEASNISENRLVPEFCNRTRRAH